MRTGCPGRPEVGKSDAASGYFAGRSSYSSGGKRAPRRRTAASVRKATRARLFLGKMVIG
jgi:hypothetical protein